MGAFIVSGSRRITDYRIVASAIDDAITKFGVYPSLIIEGGQRTYADKYVKGLIPVGGVDFHAFVWAQRHNVPHKTMSADWGKFGNAAGPIRNRKMVREGEYLVAIPDLKSRGTLDMIKAMRERHPESQIYIFEGVESCL